MVTHVRQLRHKEIGNIGVYTPVQVSSNKWRLKVETYFENKLIATDFWGNFMFEKQAKIAAILIKRSILYQEGTKKKSRSYDLNRRRRSKDWIHPKKLMRQQYVFSWRTKK